MKKYIRGPSGSSCEETGNLTPREVASIEATRLATCIVLMSELFLDYENMGVTVSSLAHYS